MEEDSGKRRKKTAPFRPSTAEIPREAALEAVEGVEAFNPQEMERSLFRQFDEQLKTEEKATRRAAREKRAAEKAVIQARLGDAQDRLEATDDARLYDKIEKQIVTLSEKLMAIRREEAAERELEELVEQEEERANPHREELVSAGLITPFEDAAAEKERREHESNIKFHVMMRKGAFEDDMDDVKFAERIRAWKTGQDLDTSLMPADDEEVEEDELANLEGLKKVGSSKKKKKNGDKDGLDEDGDEEEEDDEEEDEFEFEEVAEDNVVDIRDSNSNRKTGNRNEDEEDVFSDEGLEDEVVRNSNMAGDCDQCLQMRGMSSVLEVLGKSKPEDCNYDLPAILKQCRHKPQRALELLLATDEQELNERYPRPNQCIHASESQRAVKRLKKAAKKTSPKKRAVPEPLPLPASVIADLQMGQQASVAVDGDFRVPLETYDCLFEYQRTSLRWMWELHKQHVGGILADEMGLGKTVQVIAFLYGLYHSHLLSSPSLLICPATVMKQWVSEFHKWAPPFRVLMLHSSGKGPGKMAYSKDAALLRAIGARGAGVVVTTYEGFRRSKDSLLGIKWGYAVLDEGHKIRNPDADISLTAKQLQTHRRILLTGTPIQNSLKELWSLMDFVYPGKLGTLPIFQREFEVPIQLGGYASASPSQVMTAYRCSVTLRDLIKPFLLRRLKADVDVELPDKTEQVMMCRLTPEQVKVYRSWIYSDEVRRILDGKLNALYGISFLRKICNHPDLLKLDKALTPEEEASFGDYRLSGKMLVLHEMLPLWKQQGHRVLIFSQGVQMMNVIVKYLRQQKYSHLRMDGTTSVQSRIPLIDQFNSDPSIFVFVLTTRVGGIGVNLTGANRVVIFDPDWNPSTDMQARERAWRIGQKRKVCIYRLVTVGTIEEKVLHRQIYKTFLTQKVLQNPRQRRFFSGKDMADLFTLGREYTGNQVSQESETSRIFFDLKDKVHIKAPVDTDDGNGASQDGADAQGTRESNEDDVLLRTLLGKNERVVSALNHEAMVDNQPAEYEILQQEAESVAQQAAARVRESHQQLHATPIYQPTWTGRRGEVGVTPRFGRTLAALKSGGSQEILNMNRHNNADRMIVFDSRQQSRTAELAVPSAAKMSSSDLLSNIKKRKTAAQGRPSKKNTDEQEDAMGRRLAQDLVKFLWGNGGICSSDEIIEAFQHRLTTPEEKFSFRAMLREVAEFTDDGDWKLKQSYI